jgi:hypothetical protein
MTTDAVVSLHRRIWRIMRTGLYVRNAAISLLFVMFAVDESNRKTLEQT